MILRSFKVSEVPFLQGLEPTVTYLQQLGSEYIDLIVEFSKWVLKADRNAGFSIFAADDYPDLKNLPQVQHNSKCIDISFYDYFLFACLFVCLLDQTTR